ncbi:MAG: hypothetical protein D6675_04140 [Gemmatimonadetes bacterium]|nr:MAG: hypothetical protein D6675_04140 [Gemmatimonadota bacterium]
MARVLFDPQTPIIVLYAELHGKTSAETETSRLIRMMVSTSATYTVIPWEVAVALGHDPAKTDRRKEIVTSRGIRVVPVVTIERMNVLDKAVENIDVICHDVPQSSRVDGLIGLNFLRQFGHLYLNFERGILEIE